MDEKDVKKAGEGALEFVDIGAEKQAAQATAAAQTGIARATAQGAQATQQAAAKPATAATSTQATQTAQQNTTAQEKPPAQTAEAQPASDLEFVDTDAAPETAEDAPQQAETKKPAEKHAGLVSSRMLLGALRYAAIGVCALIVIYEAYQIISNRLENKVALDEYAALTDEMVELSADAAGLSDEGETETYPNLVVDFEKLKEINPDFAGWLYFPALDISYPIVKEQKVDEYLSKTFQGTRNGAGAVFLDSWSSKKFEGLSNFVFAHNMLNKSMFGALTLLTAQGNEHLLDDEPYIYVYTENAVYRYRAFAYYTCAAGGTVYQNVGQDASKYDIVIDYILENNQYDCPDTFDFSQRPELLNLSTCSDYGPSRFLVSGVKTYTWHTGEGAANVSEAYQELKDQYVTVNNSTGTSDNIEGVDFKGLREINPDTVGWLSVPALNLSYPVVKENEAGEYQEKNFFGEEDAQGTPYVDTHSDPSFDGLSDFIYGHYQLDGGMFGPLLELTDGDAAEKLSENPYIYVHTPEGVLTYRIYAFYKGASDDAIYTIVEDSEALYDQVVDFLKENNAYEDAPTLDLEDHPGLLTLSTCSDFGDKTRILLTGVKEN